MTNRELVMNLLTAIALLKGERELWLANADDARVDIGDCDPTGADEYETICIASFYDDAVTRLQHALHNVDRIDAALQDGMRVLYDTLPALTMSPRERDAMGF